MGSSVCATECLSVPRPHQFVASGVSGFLVPAAASQACHGSMGDKWSHLVLPCPIRPQFIETATDRSYPEMEAPTIYLRIDPV